MARNIFRVPRSGRAYRLNGTDGTPNRHNIYPFVLATLIITIGLICWFVTVYSSIPFGLAYMREIWLGRDFGLSLFEAFLIVCLLLVYLLFFDAIRYGWLSGRLPVHLAVAYLACFVVLGAMGRDLYVMRTSILGDVWYAFVSEHEALRNGHGNPALVLDNNPTSCGGVPAPCLLVQFATGQEVTAHLPNDIGSVPTEIAWVTLRLGTKTGDPYYYQVGDFIPGDTKYRWNDIKRNYDDVI